MIAIFFIYGLAYFIFGVSILIFPKKDSVFKLATSLWFIGIYGLIHGSNKWLETFVLIYQPFKPLLETISLFVLPASFVFLVLFATITIAETKNKYSPLKYLVIILIILWAIITATSQKPLLAGDIWSRYLLGIPGIFLTSYALALQIPYFKRINLPSAVWYLKIASVIFFLHGIFTGLIVPAANFFPANLINTKNLVELTSVLV